MNESMRILVVDGDQQRLHSTTSVLQQAGYAVSVAESGESALELLQSTLWPDLMLVDASVADMNEIEMRRRENASEPFASAFLILLVDEQAAAPERPADAYITRPISDHVLLAQLDAFARVATAEKALRQSQAREAHLRQVLQAVRRVTQVIVQENEPQRLIERACETLTESMGYHFAWIGLLDDSGSTLGTLAGSGAGG